MIVGTGKSDWVRDVTDEKGSLMQAVGKIGQELSNGKLMLSASNMPSGNDSGVVYDAQRIAKAQKHGEYANEGKTRCILLPRWQMVEGVGMNEAKWLLEDVIAKGSTNSSPVSKAPVQTQQGTNNGEFVVQKEPEPEVDTSEINGFAVRNDTASHTPAELMNGRAQTTSTHVPPGVTMQPLQHRAIILMCSHGTRDWRCGKSAPILKREFERHLRPLGLYRDFDDTRPGGVGIYFINHVGGHKYSANVMIYRRSGSGEKLGEESSEAVQGIWLARVRPEDCENIVKYTVLQGKLVKPQRQLRGGFDRERGVLSW